MKPKDIVKSPIQDVLRQKYGLYVYPFRTLDKLDSKSTDTLLAVSQFLERHFQYFIE